MKYCDWTYFSNENCLFGITPNKPIKRPESFFKYYPLTSYSVDALTNLYIYATHPNSLNDPFDCNKNLIQFETEDDVRALWEELTEKVINEFGGINDSLLEYCSNVFKTIMYRKVGIFSLAPTSEDLLMWPLYAQNSGFCVEYDITQFPFRYYGPFPIHYVDKIPYPVKIGKFGGCRSLLIQTNIKNKQWEYEKEWRLLIPAPEGVDMESFGRYSRRFNIKGIDHDRKFKYPISALKKVILGPKFFPYEITVCTAEGELDVSITQDNEIYSFIERILDFLSKDFCPVSFVMNEGFSKITLLPIKIYKYGEKRYRIVELYK